MKKIGEGVQFNVYNIGNGRVKKIHTSFFQKIYRLHKIAPKYKIYSHLVNNSKIAIGASKTTKLSINTLKKQLANIDLSLLGNPAIHDNGDYEQDKVSSFGDALRSSEFNKQKELVNGYIDNVLSCWDYGFSDTVFNFTINCGVTPEDKVVLVDLGELTWDKDEVTRLVQSKHWEKRSSFNRLENTQLKDYIRGQFNEKITISSLNRRWNSKINP